MGSSGEETILFFLTKHQPGGGKGRFITQGERLRTVLKGDCTILLCLRRKGGVARRKKNASFWGVGKKTRKRKGSRSGETEF